MSFKDVPSKSEIVDWDPQSLADFMRSLKLSGCDKVVMKSGISGAQFMQMAESDLHLFPGLFVPIITKIQSEINKGEQKKPFGHKLIPRKSPKQAFVQAENVWDSDEFDNGSDGDYEGPLEEGGGGDYIHALDEPTTREQQISEASSEDDNESAETTRPPKPPRMAKRRDVDPVPVERIIKPPRRISITPTPYKPPAPSKPRVPVDRSKKPGQPCPAQRDLKNSKGSTVPVYGAPASKIPPRGPKPTDVSNRANRPTPPVPRQPARVSISLPEPRTGFDPSWYGGNVTRHQAEVVLRDMNKDGAFVVRDSSKGSPEHPYTLMLLKEGKVYNIQIRKQGNAYSLGTGLNNTKSFPGVEEMITHHTHTPLLLIDATDQISEAHSQCCLLHPAGL